MDDRMILENIEKKDEFFLTAIRNLIRKNNYLELFIQQKEEEITKKQFDQELKVNPNKYIIQQFKLKNPTDITFLIEIYKSLEKFFKDIGKENISLDEISEIFSVDQQQLIETVKMLKSNIRKQFML